MPFKEKSQMIILLLLLTALTAVVVWLWSPFFQLIAFSGIIAVLFAPIYRQLLKESNNESLAAMLTLGLVSLCIILPVYLLAQALIGELANVYNLYQQGGIKFDQVALAHYLPVQLQGLAIKIFADAGLKISAGIAGIFATAMNMFSNLANCLLGLVLVYFTSFYLLRDGKKLKNYIYSVLPLSPANQNLLINKLTEAINGVVKGSFMVALIQAAVAVVGFWFFGLPNVFLWGAFTVFAALVPNLGTSLVMIPAVIYLVITGAAGNAVGLAIWGAVAVGTIDNLVGPKLIGSKTRIHPLVVFFSVIGGLKFYGYLGFLLGPITVAVFIALLDIYQLELQSHYQSENFLCSGTNTQNNS